MITTLPPAPSRSDDPAGFSAKADALLAALDQFIIEANALGVQIADDAAAAATSASNAEAHKNAAQLAATAAETSAQNAAGISGAPMWVSGNSYTFGAFVWSPTSLLSYRRTTPGTTVSNVDPATGLASGWKLANASTTLPQIEINSSGAYQLIAGYHYRVKNPLAVLTMPVSAVQEQVRIEDASDGTTVQIWPEAGGKFKNRDVALLLSTRGFDKTFTQTTEGWV